MGIGKNCAIKRPKNPSSLSHIPFSNNSSPSPSLSLSISKTQMELLSAALFGLLLASILPLIFFFAFKDGINNSSPPNPIHSKSINSPSAAALQIPPHSDDDHPDVIVVGAGVAGAALAFTLAKVRRLSLPHFLLFVFNFLNFFVIILNLFEYIKILFVF